MAARSVDVPLTARQMAWGAGTLAVIAALATLSAWPLYDTPRLAIVALAGVLVGASPVVLGWALKWKWWLSAPLVVVAYALTVVAVAIPSAMGSPTRWLRGMGEGITGIVLGWKRLLTIALPAETYQGVMVPFYVVMVAGTAVAVALMLHGKRFAPFAVVPMLAMVTFGAIFGSGEVGTEAHVGALRVPAALHVAVGAGAVVVLVVWLLGGARIARADALRRARGVGGGVSATGGSLGFAVRRQAMGAALVAVTVVGALALAPVATALGPRDVPRNEVDPLLVLRQQTSPLSAYRAWFTVDSFDAELFRVEGARDVDRIRLATLNGYDGQTYHVSGDEGDLQFAREPREQPAQVTVTIGDAYTGVWVPLASVAGGSPVFSGPRGEALRNAYYASTTLDAGVVVFAGDAPQGLRSGDAISFAAAPSPSLDHLERASGADPLIAAEDYPALAAWVDYQNLGRSGADVIELVNRLRERGYLSHSTRDNAAARDWVSDLTSRSSYVFLGNRPGHSGARIDELFTTLLDQERRAGVSPTPAQLVSGVGDDEQFATAAALVAQYLGFPSRVVVGVRVGTADAADGVPACAESCTGANVTAWAEVRDSSGTWYPLDATAQFATIPDLLQEGQDPPRNPTEPEQVEADVIEPPSSVSETTATSDPVDPEPEPWSSRVLPYLLAGATVGLGALLALVPFMVLPLAKASRRRRRRRATQPEVRMVGAWEELVDRYVDLGFDIPRGLTRAEVSDVLERPQASTVAVLVDQAVFAEHPPTPEWGDEVWSIVDNEVREVTAAAPRMRRLRARFTPASLRARLRRDSRQASATLRRKDRHG